MATPANAFSAPGPYCIAKTPGGRPFATRAKPSAMWTPTRSCRQITGRMPTAAAASMIGVVGKQNRVETPSRFRISAMTCMTCIGRSSHWVEFTSAHCDLPCHARRGGAHSWRRGYLNECSRNLTNNAAGIGATDVAFRPVADRHAGPHVARVLHQAGATVRARRLGGGGRRLRRRRAGAPGEHDAPRNQQE